MLKGNWEQSLAKLAAIRAETGLGDTVAFTPLERDAFNAGGIISLRHGASKQRL